MANKILSLVNKLPSSVINPIKPIRRHAAAIARTEQYEFTQVTTLDNGFRVATEDFGNPTASVGLCIDAGTRFETQKTNGVAHFLEHMIFKGTERRTQTDLELEVENMGAHLNAYTSRESTVYYAKCLSKDMNKAVDILADIVQHSLFPVDAIERERGVILREMEEVERNLQEVAMDYVHATAFQEGPLAMTILGPVENINSISRADIQDYIATHYTPDRMVLAAAGGVNHDELVQLADKYFGHAKPGHFKDEMQAQKYVGSEIRLSDNNMPLAHVVFAVEGSCWDSGDSLPLMVANTILGHFDRSAPGGARTSNRLASEVAKHNIAHSFQSFNTCYSDTGLWGMYFVTDRENVASMINATQHAWLDLCRGLSEGEVERAKQSLLTNIQLQLDGTTPIFEDIGRQLLCYGRRIPIYELRERINRITSADVQHVCSKYLYDQPPVCASVGPVDGIQDYNAMRAGMSLPV